MLSDFNGLNWVALGKLRAFRLIFSVRVLWETLGKFNVFSQMFSGNLNVSGIGNSLFLCREGRSAREKEAGSP